MAIPPFVEKLLASIAWDALKALWDYFCKYGPEDIKKLKEKMKEILEDLIFVSDLEDPGGRTNQWIIDARELVCDIQDVICKCKDLDMKAAKNKLEEIAEKIKSTPTYFSLSGHIKQSTDDAAAAEERYKKVNMALGGGGEDLRYTPLRQPPSPGLVGIEHPKKKIISLLNIADVPAAADDKDRKPIGHMVVSIAGVGGMGKTTLAAQVSNQIAEKFDCEARVVVSRKRRPKEILMSLLQEFDTKHTDLSTCDTTTLGGYIQKHVKDKRFLVVLDDVWGDDDDLLLENINNALFSNERGGRIILTTRNNDVATKWCSSVGDHVYQIKPLNEGDAREVLLRDVRRLRKPQMSEQYVDKILTMCDGSPLALAAASDLAVHPSKKGSTIRWDEVYRIMSKIEGPPKIQRMRKDLSHSYFDLPYHERDCLLYLSLFPNDEINKKRLVSRWVAEELVADEEEAKKMFEDLISRNLILPPEIKYDGDVSTYRVHHTIHDFVVWKSAEYNFITLPSAIDQTERKIRRISLHKNTEGGSDIKLKDKLKDKDLSHLRSLSLFGPGDLPEKVPSILRVLDLENCPNADLKSLELFHDNLKYLKISEGLKGFKCAKLFEKYLLSKGAEGLLSPENLRLFVTATQGLERIGSARHLQTLDLRGIGEVKLNAAITALKSLVRLLVDPQTTLPNEIGKMTALEELELINVSSYDLNVLVELSKLPKLRTMGIYLSADSPSNKDSRLLKSIITLVKREEGLRSLFIDGDFKTPISIDPSLWGQVVEHLRKFRVRCRLSAVPKLTKSCEELEKLRLGVPVINLDTEVTMLAELCPNLTHLFLDLYGSPQGDIAFNDIKRFQYLKCLGLGIWSDSLEMKVTFPMGAPQDLKLQLDADGCEKPQDLPDGFNYSTIATTLARGRIDRNQAATTWTKVHITTRTHQGNENKKVEVEIKIQSRSATLRITENVISSNNGHMDPLEGSTDQESTSAPADISMDNNCISLPTQSDSTASTSGHRKGKQPATIGSCEERIIRNGINSIRFTEPEPFSNMHLDDD